jgi:hypothetical protein
MPISGESALLRASLAVQSRWSRIHLTRSPLSPKFLLDGDGDEMPHHLRHGRDLSLGQCVVLLWRQMDNGSKVQRLRIRPADRMINVKQRLMAIGPKSPVVLAHQFRSAEKQDLAFPGTQVDFFQNLSVGVGLPRTLLARPEEPLVPSANVFRPTIVLTH